MHNHWTTNQFKYRSPCFTEQLINQNELCTTTEHGHLKDKSFHDEDILPLCVSISLWSSCSKRHLSVYAYLQEYYDDLIGTWRTTQENSTTTIPYGSGLG